MSPFLGRNWWQSVFRRAEVDSFFQVFLGWTEGERQDQNNMSAAQDFFPKAFFLLEKLEKKKTNSPQVGGLLQFGERKQT